MEGFVDIDALAKENARNLELCKENGTNAIIIDERYEVDADIWK